MCGIAGIWGRPGSDHRAALGRMLEAERHRGPDGEGRLDYAGGAAGMVRLALVDPTERGQQPIWSPDRRVAILFNGEVYNFREHRERLAASGYPFQSTTDTEVVLALYLERGESFVSELRGMFGLAIFDFRDSGPDAPPRLILARDPFGMKPLYIYRARSGELLFSSEIRSLLASGLVPRQIDRRGLADYLQFGFVLQPGTILEGVRMLPAGVLEIHTIGGPPKSIRFWSFPAAEPRNETLPEAAQRLRAALDESVRLHSFADVPVGAFLSGGVDSTAIVSLMRPHLSRLKVYTLRLPDVPGTDESRYALETAKILGCEATLVEATGAEIAGFIPRFTGEIDQPSVDGLNTWLLSRAAARDVKGILTGLGGDDWFAGYPVVQRMWRYQNTTRGKLFAALGNVAAPIARRAPLSKIERRLSSLSTRRSPWTTWGQTHGVFSPPEAARLLPSAAGEIIPRLYDALRDNGGAPEADETAIGIACHLDARVYMKDQLLRDCDALSMAHSLELRLPLVDLAIAQVSRTVRDDHKLSPNTNGGLEYGNSGAKRVLIEAVKDLLPPDIFQRPKKGFSLPIPTWLRGPVGKLADQVDAPRALAKRGLLDTGALPFFRGPVGDYSNWLIYPRAWSLLVLELWLQQVIDVQPVAAAPRPAIVL